MIVSAKSARERLVVFHPSPAMVGTMDSLLHAIVPAARRENLIVPDLLDRVVRDGLTPSLYTEVENLIGQIKGAENTLILCTCSTLGGYAEKAGRNLGRQVIRIDRPMAERAVEIGKRIGLAFALESTVEPTRKLLEEIAAARGKKIEIKLVSCAEAWPHKKKGDEEAYIDTVAGCIKKNAKDLDVIVLAQGSMAPAQEKCGSLGTSILSSPVLAIEAVTKMMGIGKNAGN